MKKKEEVIKTEPDKATEESIVQTAGKILDSALCLIDKRISFASKSEDVLNELIDYIDTLDKEDMSKTEKNYLIRKINDLKIDGLQNFLCVFVI